MRIKTTRVYPCTLDQNYQGAIWVKMEGIPYSPYFSILFTLNTNKIIIIYKRIRYKSNVSIYNMNIVVICNYDKKYVGILRGKSKTSGITVKIEQSPKNRGGGTVDGTLPEYGRNSPLIFLIKF